MSPDGVQRSAVRFGCASDARRRGDTRGGEDVARRDGAPPCETRQRRPRLALPDRPGVVAPLRTDRQTLAPHGAPHSRPAWGPTLSPRWAPPSRPTGTHAHARRGRTLTPRGDPPLCPVGPRGPHPYALRGTPPSRPMGPHPHGSSSDASAPPPSARRWRRALRRLRADPRLARRRARCAGGRGSPWRHDISRGAASSARTHARERVSCARTTRPWRA